jgi:hypothetical protein
MLGRIIGGIFDGVGSIFGGILGCLLGTVGRILLPLMLVGAVLLFVLNPNSLLAFLSFFQGGNMQVRTAPAVVTQIQGRSTLVTAEFQSQVHAEVSNESPLSFLPGEELWLVAEGTILAGIDLHHIDESKVTVNGREVIIQVPPAYIISQEMKNIQMRTQEGILPGVATEMQQLAEDKAHEELLHAACEYGLLQKAEEEAQTALTDLLTPMGFQTIRLVQQDARPGEFVGCPGNSLIP